MSEEVNEKTLLAREELAGIKIKQSIKTDRLF